MEPTIVLAWRPRGRTVGSKTDSPVEGTGFEPSVPRERLVPSFSFTPTFPLARVNRPDPIPKAYIRRGPMVRIRLPPAGSPVRTWFFEPDPVPAELIRKILEAAGAACCPRTVRRA